MSQASAQPHTKKKDVWEKRYDALMATLDGLEKLNKPGTRRGVTLGKLIAGLRDESKKHFGYFHTGFFGKGQGEGQFMPRRGRDRKVLLSAEYAMRNVINRIAYDVDAIQAALRQRQPELDNVVLEGTGVAVNLELTDRLAFAALDLADQEVGLIKRGGRSGPRDSVLTYFSDAVFTRVIPYASVSFVSVPLSSRLSSRDLLAIPHEVGHYAYWNGDEGQLVADQLGEISIGLAAKAQWHDLLVLNWVEEIFADIYGLLVAGPVMALDFQDLLLQFARDDFDSASENRDHPTSILRPFIYTHVLRKVDFDNVSRDVLDKLAGKLEERWREKLRERGYEGIPAKALPLGDDGIIATQNQGQPQDLIAAVGGPLVTIVDLILDILKPARQRWALAWPIADPDTASVLQAIADSPEEDALEGLYTKFEQDLAKLATEETPDIPEGETLPGPHYPDPKAEKNWLRELKNKKWVTKGPHSLMGDDTG